jgi:hypothetical protein
MALGKGVGAVLLAGMMSVGCNGPMGGPSGGNDESNDSGASPVGSGSGDSNANGREDSGAKTSADASPSKGPATTYDASGGEDTGSGGFDAGPSCHGTPTPCDLLASCTTAGCISSDTGCSGVATACFEIFSSFECTSQEGCYWTASSSTCTGLSYLCTENMSAESCTLEQGCSWTDPSCTGIPAVSCALADTAGECGIIEGCFWE